MKRLDIVDLLDEAGRQFDRAYTNKMYNKSYYKIASHIRMPLWHVLAELERELINTLGKQWRKNLTR